MATKHWKRLAYAALGIAALLLAACGGGSSAAAPGGGAPGASAGGAPARQNGAPRPGAGGRFNTAVTVQAVTIHVGPLRTSNSTAGTIVAVTQSSVASQVAGVVAAVVHQAGDWVREGANIVQLDDSQLKLAVQTAQSNLAIARINYEIGQDNANQSAPKLALQVQSAQSAVDSAQKAYDTQQALFAVGGATAGSVDNARAQLQQAQANLQAAQQALDQNSKSGTQTLAQLKLAIDQAQNALQMAQLNLQNAAIKAPFGGQIAAVNVNPGMYVGLNTAVFVLVSAEREVAFNVSPSDASTLPTGTAVTFSYQGKDYPARINQAPSAPINGVVPMVAALSKAGSLTYGTVGTVSYSLTLASGALIPIAALQVNEDQNFVYAINAGKVTVRPITILAESGITAAASGVAEGTQIVVNPPPGLLEGSQVQVVGLDGASAAPGPTNGAPGPGAPAAMKGPTPGAPAAMKGPSSGAANGAPAAQPGAGRTP